MKNIKKLSLAGVMALFLALFSCSTEPVIHSKVTYYPEITINGDAVAVVKKGSSYAELGAESIAGGAKLAVTTTGTVDSNTIGVYKIVYESVNTDGFSASKTRTVIVVSPNPSAINLEGTFYRGANANVVTRISDRVYRCNNATGYTMGDPNNLTLVFYNLDDTKLYAPFTLNASATGISAESNIGTIVSANKWSWSIFASGFFGTATRTFTR